MPNDIDKSLLDRLQALRGSSAEPERPAPPKFEIDVIERAKTPSREDALAARLKSLRSQSGDEAPSPPNSNRSSAPGSSSPAAATRQTPVKPSQSRSFESKATATGTDASTKDEAESMFETDDQTLEELLGDLGPEDTFSTQEPEVDDEKVKALLEELSQAIPKDDEEAKRSSSGDAPRDEGGHDSDDSDGEHMTREVRETIERLRDEAELEGPTTRDETNHSDGQSDTQGDDADLALPSVPTNLADLPATSSNPRAGSADMDDITARMAALRAPGPSGDDDGDSGLNLPSVPTSRPSGKPVKRLTSRTAYTDDDADGWCTVCLEDATLRCLGCDGDPYCPRCWRDMHVGPAAGFDERTHKAVQLTKSSKKEEKRRVALGA